jgi:DNA-binding response OmpR family regulator
VYAFGRIVLEVLAPNSPTLIHPKDAQVALAGGGASDELARLVAQALHYQPALRPTAAALRQALRVHLSGTPTIRSLELDADGQSFALDGEGCAVSSRTARRLLVALAQAHPSALNIEQLFKAGWPGERVVASAQKNRVFVSLSKLRKYGLEGKIDRVDDGYRLAPGLRIVWRTLPPEAADFG